PEPRSQGPLTRRPRDSRAIGAETKEIAAPHRFVPVRHQLEARWQLRARRVMREPPDPEATLPARGDDLSIGGELEAIQRRVRRNRLRDLLERRHAPDVQSPPSGSITGCEQRAIGAERDPLCPVGSADPAEDLPRGGVPEDEDPVHAYGREELAVGAEREPL